mgnify:CR=1 FL=1
MEGGCVEIMLGLSGFVLRGVFRTKKGDNRRPRKPNIASPILKTHSRIETPNPRPNPDSQNTPKYSKIPPLQPNAVWPPSASWST